MARKKRQLRYRFNTISSVVPEASASWENSLFLTVDIDWACDDVLENTVNMLEAADVAATFFVTHDTPVLDRLRANPRFELGIHPNFNALLAGDPAPGSKAIDIVERLLELMPQAKSVRSHSITQSTGLLDIFHRVGLTHDCNNFIPASSNITLKPYRLWNGLIKVPYFWEDDVDLLYRRKPDILALVEIEGLRVFNFHPIHIALNSTTMDAYETSRHVHRDWLRLREYVCPGIGVGTAFKTLLSLAKNACK